MSDISDAQKVEILYKKNLGIPTTFPGAQTTSEPTISALPSVIPDLQIFSQPIPSTAPTDLIEDASFVQVGNSLGKRFISNSFPYIVKYENIQLTEQNTKLSYKGTYNLNGNTINLLRKTIPFNYDPLSSYNISINLFDGMTNKIISSAILPSNYDRDAGFITFYGTDSNKTAYLQKAPIMTFWRYEGKMGMVDLEKVLQIGNSAGNADLNMNSQNITNAFSIQTSSISSVNNILTIQSNATYAPQITVSNECVSFSQLPICNASPSGNDMNIQLVNKQYVDSQILSSSTFNTNYTDSNFVSLSTTQSINGLKRFNTLPIYDGSQNPTNSSNLITKQYVDTSISNLIDGAPETLNALNELANALKSDASFAETVLTQIGTKGALDGYNIWTNNNEFKVFPFAQAHQTLSTINWLPLIL